MSKPPPILRLLFLGSLIALAATSAVQASTYYVAAGGNDSAPGTLTQPFRTLNHGATLLQPGDTLLVRSGTYSEALENSIPGGTSWNSPVTVSAYPGETVTLRPPAGHDRVLFFGASNRAYIIVSGLILDGANINYDAVKVTAGSSTGASHHIRLQNCEIKNAPQQGILLSASSHGNELINLKVHDNGFGPNNELTPAHYHGVYVESNDNLIDHSEFYNHPGHGVHVYMSDGVNGTNTQNNIVRFCKCHDNGGAGIGLYTGNNNVAYNNLLWKNKRGFQVGYGATNSRVYNNTLYKNAPQSFEGDIMLVFSGVDGGGANNTQITNNIISDSTGWAIAIEDNGSSGVTAQNNLFFNNSGGTVTGAVSQSNNKSGDPLFANAASFDFHLRSGSPAIDAGTTLSAVTTDFDGLTRHAPYEIGAFEVATSPPPVAPTISAQPQNASIQSGQNVTFSVSASGTAPMSYQWKSKAPGASTFSAISGATSASYTMTNVQQLANGTEFQCLITNTAGSVTSNVVTLTVNSAQGTTWYIRKDGGTATQCNGKTDAAYSGSGTNQPCAFNHLSWLLPPVFGANVLMAGGDTVIIDDLDHATGKQAQYVEGMEMPNNGACSWNFPWDCRFQPIPPGPDKTHMTKIYGKQWNSGCGQKPQLWGENGIYMMLVLGGDNIDLQCLELTDHSNCISNGPSGNINGESVSCSTAQQLYAGTGIGSVPSVDNINIKNLYIHGLATRGIDLGSSATPGIVGDITIDRTVINANGFEAFQTEEKMASRADGTKTFTNGSIEWSGCGERYPLPNTVPDSVANVHHCTSQNQVSLPRADGIAFGFKGNSTTGNWILDNMKIRWNTQDGFDTIHGVGNSYTKVTNSWFEGNGGAALKIDSADADVNNNLFIGNCGFFANQAFTTTAAESPQGSGFLSCRAGAVVDFPALPRANIHFYNNTLFSNQDVMLRYFPSVANICTSQTVYHVKNNVFLGGTDFVSDVPALGDWDYSDSIYQEGCDQAVLDEDYNIGWHVKHPEKFTSPHDIYADPQITGSFKIGPEYSDHNGPSHDPTAYYQGLNGGQQFYLRATSPAKDKGVVLAGISRFDFNNFDRGTTWDLGALEYGSGGGGGTIPPSIITQPQNQNVTAGQNASFTVTASGTSPLGYQWQSKVSGASTFSNISGATSPSYALSNAQPSNGGTQFQCVVSNSAGSVTSNPATLTVAAVSVPPTVTTQPQNSSVIVGQNASFSITASGTSPLSYQWQAKTSGTNTFTAISGATTASYTKNNVQLSDNGMQLRCMVSNGAGSATSNPATLTVASTVIAPVIIQQPSDQTVELGNRATFSVSATGTAPRYQWQSKGPGSGIFVDILSANGPSYITPPASSADDGTQLRCRVSNSSGNVTSHPAIWRVNSMLPPPILNLPAFLPVNGLIQLTYPAGYAITSFQWSFELQPSISASASASSITAFARSAPVSAFATSVPQANLGPHNLQPGYYQISVRATDAANRVSSPAQAFATLVLADLSRARVFPNPWRADKHIGLPITFDGLTLNSIVRIFTASGRLVRTLPLTHSSITWNLTTESGDKVASGLYLYSITSDAGKKRGKLAIIK